MRVGRKFLHRVPDNQEPGITSFLTETPRKKNLLNQGKNDYNVDDLMKNLNFIKKFTIYLTNSKLVFLEEILDVTRPRSCIEKKIIMKLPIL